jgi:two-component system chemotaxis sensor kinase CheA
MMQDHEESELFRSYEADAAQVLSEIEESLLVLEERPRDLEQVNRLYRALHTLKGNSALLGLTQIEHLAHAAEDMIGLVRDRNVEFQGVLVDLMLRVKDELSVVLAQVANERRDAAEHVFLALRGEIAGWIEDHGGIQREASVLSRGELEIWSSVPPPEQAAPSAPVTPDDVLLQLDQVLGRARALMLAARAQVARLRRADVAAQLCAQCDELRAAADQAHEPELAKTANLLGHVLVTSPLSLEQLVSRFEALHAALLQVEARHRAASAFADDFGVRDLGTALLEELATLLRASNPSPVASPRARPAAGSRAQDEDVKPDYLRIDARKVSLLLELAGEIALACGAVTHHPGVRDLAAEGFEASAQKLEQLIRELQNEVSGMRLVPVAGVFQRMKRVVRDTCQRTGKRVELELRGEETEIDKIMVDALHDPLVHLIRNAIDHGIELPADRVAAGKPEVGHVVLEASHQGGEISVRVRDDGRGLGRDRIRARAQERGLIAEQAVLTDEQILELIFLPGFSTKEKIDELSGRGVGMDVIRTSVESLRGRVQLESREGAGSSVNMTVPLTLAFVEAMIVREREQLFALPIEKVIEVFKPEPWQLVESSADGSKALRVRDNLIPVLWLHRFFADSHNLDERLGDRVVVIVQAGRGTIAIPVHQLLGNQPIMLKPLRGVLARVRAAAGCGMLRSGDIALALDCDGLHV